LVDSIDDQEDQESTVEGLGLVANPRNNCNNDTVADGMSEHVAAALTIDISHAKLFNKKWTHILERGPAAGLVRKSASVGEEPDPVQDPPAEVNLGGVDQEMFSQLHI